MYRELVEENENLKEQFLDFHKVIFEKELDRLRFKNVEERKCKDFMLVYKGFSLFVVSSIHIRRYLFHALTKTKSQGYILECMKDMLNVKFKGEDPDEKSIITPITRYRMKFLTITEAAILKKEARKPNRLFRYWMYRILGI